MICELYSEEKHYPDMAVWWIEHDYGATPAHVLPPTGLVMYSDEGNPVCAGFLYNTDGGFAILDHIVSDPKSDKFTRAKLLDVLLLNLLTIAKQRGYRLVSAAAGNPVLTERYEKLGFKMYDQGVTILAKEC